MKKFINDNVHVVIILIVVVLVVSIYVGKKKFAEFKEEVKKAPVVVEATTTSTE
jgi:hypothetical protein